MTRWGLVACIVIAGCGRVHFASDPDADPSDASTSLDGPEPCPPFATFCDGFESVGLGMWSSVYTPSAQMVDGVHVHTGRFALDAHVPPSGGTGGEGGPALMLAQTISGTFAVREWVYSEQPIINYIGTVFVYSSANPTGQYIEGLGDDVGNWAVTEDSPVGMLHDHTGSTAAATNAWVCVELVIAVGATASNRMQLFIDGNLAIDAAFDDPAPTYDAVAVGVTRANTAGFELFIDDVVFAAQRIGC